MMHTGTIAQNRKARFNYTIVDEIEAGLILEGTEVKSLRLGKANITDAHAGEKEGSLWLFNANIDEYEGANRFNHQPRRPRQLLLKKKEVSKLLGKIQTKGMTIVPISLYFNDKGIAKVKLGLVQGRKQYEKREVEKEREWKRKQSALLKRDT